MCKDTKLISKKYWQDSSKACAPGRVPHCYATELTGTRVPSTYHCRNLLPLYCLANTNRSQFKESVFKLTGQQTVL